MTDPEFRIRIVESLAEVSAAAWNRCARFAEIPSVEEKHEVKPVSEECRPPVLSTRGYSNNPFIAHEFLSSLEESGSIGGRTGWQPRHVLAESAAGTLLGAAPCYVKSHSRGEYVFDH